MNLRSRIAACLGWTVEDTKGFSLGQLRAFVRTKDPVLDADIADFQLEGRHLFIKGVREYPGGKLHFPDPLA